MEIEIAKLFNISYNNETGEMFLKFQVVDPVWKQKILREQNDVEIKLVINTKSSSVEE